MVREAAGGRKRCRDVQVRLASAQLPSAIIAFAFQTTLAPVHAVHFDSEVALFHEEVWIHGQRYPV